MDIKLNKNITEKAEKNTFDSIFFFENGRHQEIYLKILSLYQEQRKTTLVFNFKDITDIESNEADDLRLLSYILTAPLILKMSLKNRESVKIVFSQKVKRVLNTDNPENLISYKIKNKNIDVKMKSLADLIKLTMGKETTYKKEDLLLMSNGSEGLESLKRKLKRIYIEVIDQKETITLIDISKKKIQEIEENLESLTLILEGKNITELSTINSKIEKLLELWKDL